MPSEGRFGFWNKRKESESLEFISEEKILIRKNINILIIFILALLLIYFLANFLKKELEGRLKLTQTKHQELSNELIKSINSEAVLFLNRLDVLKNLLQNHAYWSNVFVFLERSTLPNVRYTSFDGNLQNKTITLNAKTSDLFSMVKQIIYFENLPEVKEAKFMNVSYTEEGINFTLQLTLSESIWRKD